MGAPALALFLALFFMALAPLLDAVRKILPLTALAVALAAFVSGASMTHYSAKHPKPSALLYTLDADTGKAVWASNAARADNWTAQFVGSTPTDRKSTRLNSSHGYISYAVFCLKKKKTKHDTGSTDNTNSP